MLTDQYIAGFFDGEGCVTISQRGRVQITIAQNEREVLDLIQKKYGGGIHIKDLKVKSCYHWRLSKAALIEKFLIKILPFCMIKNNEIRIALKGVALTRRNNKGCNPLSNDEYIQRMFLRDELHSTRQHKRFRGSTHSIAIYRQGVKEKYENRCCECKKDLKDLSPIYQIVSDDKLYCRSCNAKRHIKELKPRTKQEIEEAINSTKNLDEAAKKLGIVRSSLLKKRKQFKLI
jgi:hypothetical protein